MMSLNLSLCSSFDFHLLFVKSGFLSSREDGNPSNQISSNPTSEVINGGYLDLKTLSIYLSTYLHIYLSIYHCGKRNINFAIIIIFKCTAVLSIFPLLWSLEFYHLAKLKFYTHWISTLHFPSPQPLAITILLSYSEFDYFGYLI